MMTMRYVLKTEYDTSDPMTKRALMHMIDGLVGYSKSMRLPVFLDRLQIAKLKFKKYRVERRIFTVTGELFEADDYGVDHLFELYKIKRMPDQRG